MSEPANTDAPTALTPKEGANQGAEQGADGFGSLGEFTADWLRGLLPESMVGEGVILALHAGLVAVVCLLALVLTRTVLLRIVASVIRRSNYTWDDIFLDANFFRNLSNLAAALVLYLGSLAFFGEWDLLRIVVERVALGVVVVYALMSFFALLNAVNALYNRRPNARNRPIKGYLSLVKIVTALVGTIIIVAILVDRSPLLLLTGLGAMTAVLLLIFKDTILSVVAAVTLGANDMVRIGDWISVPSAGADGDVIDIALHHVKVQNWDKTIVTIPSYKLIADSFVNWRGMLDSGGRRIKRSFNVDLTTIGFLDDEQIERFGKFVLLKDYIAEKKRILEDYNATHESGGLTANSRRLTNVGTLRAYIVNYLRSLDTVHQEGMTFMVRQLQPGEHGLPIEIYVFTKTTAWTEFEAIQSDIFDHLLAIVPEFGLRVFQSPSGSDVTAAALALRN